MTKAIAGSIIILALAYVAMRLTFYIARLWDDRHATARRGHAVACGADAAGAGPEARR